MSIQLFFPNPKSQARVRDGPPARELLTGENGGNRVHGLRRAQGVLNLGLRFHQPLSSTVSPPLSSVRFRSMRPVTTTTLRRAAGWNVVSAINDYSVGLAQAAIDGLATGKCPPASPKSPPDGRSAGAAPRRGLVVPHWSRERLRGSFRLATDDCYQPLPQA